MKIILANKGELHMEQRILENIPFNVDRGTLFETYHIEEGSDDSKRIDQLIAEAEKQYINFQLLMKKLKIP